MTSRSPSDVGRIMSNEFIGLWVVDEHAKRIMEMGYCLHNISQGVARDRTWIIYPWRGFWNELHDIHDASLHPSKLVVNVIFAEIGNEYDRQACRNAKKN